MDRFPAANDTAFAIVQHWHVCKEIEKRLQQTVGTWRRSDASQTQESAIDSHDHGES